MISSQKSSIEEIPDTLIATDKVMLSIEQFDVGQSYVIARVENRYGDTVRINIQGGAQGIELQETLFISRADGLGLHMLRRLSLRTKRSLYENCL